MAKIHLLATGVVAALGVHTGAHAQESVAAFYAGKTITLTVAAGAGGGGPAGPVRAKRRSRDHRRPGVQRRRRGGRCSC